MESQLTRTQGHQYESTDLSVNPSALHSGVEGHPEGEGHHEKQSVLKKVKAKAKKIKNTLTKHGHEHDHDHGHSPEEYEEDEDEEMAEDPDIHGAPTYESEAVRAATRASSGHTTGGTNFDRPFGDPRYDSTKPTAGGTNFDRPSMVGGGPHYDSTKPTAGGTNFDRPSMVGDPHYDSTKPIGGGTNFDRPSMVGGGPHYDSTKPTTGGTNFDMPSMVADPHYDSTKPIGGGTNFDGPSMVGGGPHYDSTKPTTGGTNFNRPSMVGDPHYDSTGGGTNFDRPSMVGGGPHYDSTKPITGGTNFDRPSMVGDPHYDSTKPTGGGTNFDRPSMVGGGPHYDSTKPITGGTNFDRPSMVGDPHYDSTKPTVGGSNFDRPSMVGGGPHYDSPILDPETRPSAQWQADEEHGKHLLKEDKHPELPHKGINTRNTRTGRDVSEERKNPDAFGGRNAMEGIRGGIGTTGFQVDPQGPNIRTHPSNVQVKTIDPAGIGSEEAEGITPLIKSINKMGISEDKPNTEQAEGLYTESHDQFAPEPMPRKSSDSVPKSYNAANPQEMPGDISEPARNSSTYTEKITSASAAAASAIAGTAQSAKSAIASKIEQMRKPGEGNKTGSMTGTATAQSAKSTTASKIEQMREPGEGNKTGSMTGTASDYAHRIAATVTDTLAPVYGKVVGVGSGATSKGSELGAETTQESGGRVGQEKGVSVKEYWVEKLKPGEEDRALSSIITDSFRKPKGDKGEKMEEVPSGGGGGGRGISQVVSDAVHKREPEESEKPKPMGKVTESEEVAKRLGTGEEGSGLENIGTGEGVVNKLTGAIGSWLGGQGGRALRVLPGQL